MWVESSAEMMDDSKEQITDPRKKADLKAPKMVVRSIMS